MKSFFALVVFATACLAHFDIDYPPPRDGTEDLTELIHPCGGLPLGNRTVITPVDGVFNISGSLEHPFAQANFSIVVGDEDPTDSEFGQTFFPGGLEATEYMGDFDFPANITSIPEIVDGSNAVIQVAMITVDGYLTVCMDVTFSIPTCTKETLAGTIEAQLSGIDTLAPCAATCLGAVGITSSSSADDIINACNTSNDEIFADCILLCPDTETADSDIYAQVSSSCAAIEAAVC
ncbi:hypothetical protein HDU84_002664 [Entophlyctis sp. JEL0112]|nr:hypothetical protein HDU84_002664 [Entophlyctis sp. JEL0112]